jgi:hypothetical protein
MSADVLLAYTLGGLTGAAVTWFLAVAQERVRRVRRDLKAARKGVKTLRRMLRRYLGDLIKAALVVALVVGGLIVLATR